MNRPTRGDTLRTEKSTSVASPASAPAPALGPDGHAPRATGQAMSAAADEEELVAMALKMGISKERSAIIARMALEEEEADALTMDEKSYLRVTRDAGPGGDAEDESEGDEEEELGAAAKDGQEEEEEATAEDKNVYLPIAPTISIFDSASFATTEECVDHMREKFGFFIPDRPYLQDLDGLLTYLGEKVKIGGICLYCQKQLGPGWPCQKHMAAKGHCKLKYEEGVDMDEFEDFYDFSSSYSEADLDEEGEPIPQKTITEMHTGELMLPNGDIIGHRRYRRIYNAYYAPEDTRPAVLAAKREALLRMEQRTGQLGMDERQIDRLSDLEITSLMVKERRAERRLMVLAERDKRRFMFREQRREYKSTKDKIRSSENTTAKIRDYHSMLM